MNILRKHRKAILLTISVLITISPWIFLGRSTQDGFWSLSSKSFRSAIGTNHIEAVRNEIVYIDESFNLLFVTGRESYIKISSENIVLLEQALFADMTWILPSDMVLKSSSLSVSPRMITWSDNSILDAIAEEAGISSASGLSLDIQGSIYISDTANLGKSNIVLNFPHLPEIETQLDANAIFPNDDIRLDSTKIQGQVINIHETVAKKMLASNGRWILTFIGVALFLFSLFFLVSETDDD